jgi:hypothetical protein
MQTSLFRIPSVRHAQIRFESLAHSYSPLTCRKSNDSQEIKPFLMCPECARLRAKYGTAVEGLTAAQRELARYRIANDPNNVSRLWKECESALRTLWTLRAEMARHSATHL